MSPQRWLIAFGLIVSCGICTGQVVGTQSASGAGTLSCGKYIEDGANPQLAAHYITWAQGFLSGMNVATMQATNQALVALPDWESIKAYLDKFCRENPLKSPLAGSITLFREVRR